MVVMIKGRRLVVVVAQANGDFTLRKKIGNSKKRT